MDYQNSKERPYLRLVYSAEEIKARIPQLLECPLCGEMELQEYLKIYAVCSRCTDKKAA